MVPVVTVYNWSGCYIGANGGGKWARTSGSLDVAGGTGAAGTAAAASVPFDGVTSSTGIIGGQVGCNWQAAGSSWVFGIEGDADAQRWSATRTIVRNVPPSIIAGDSFDIRSDWQASLRGRIGYAWDRWMLYATGGVAFTNAKVGSNFIPTVAGGVTFPATVVSESKTLVGPTAGLGLEYAFSNNWSLGVEGRYSWYGTQTYNAGLVAALGLAPAGPFTFVQATQTYRVETLEVTARLNYKF
jgi:outer membrane immunogenic protein